MTWSINQGMDEPDQCVVNADEELAITGAKVLSK